MLFQEPPTRGRSTTPRPTLIMPDESNFFKKSTKENFRVTPIATHLRSGPISSSDALRNLNEDEIFKKFITTMFGSEEVKEYLDQFDSDSDAPVDATTRDIARAASVKPTIEPTTEATAEEDLTYEYPDTKKGSGRMVTTIDNFDETEVQSEQYEETTLADLLQDKDIDEEVQAEQNIAKLIDDIDIQELLASDIENELFLEENDKYSEEKIKPSKQKKEQKIQKSEEDTVESTVEISLEGSSENTNDDLTYKIITTTTTAKPKDKKHSKKKYKDVTFRQNNTGGILDIFSQNDLLKLFHEAVADAAAQSDKTDSTATTSTTQTQLFLTKGIVDRREAGLSIPIS